MAETPSRKDTRASIRRGCTPLLNRTRRPRSGQPDPTNHKQGAGTPPTNRRRRRAPDSRARAQAQVASPPHGRKGGRSRRAPRHRVRLPAPELVDLVPALHVVDHPAGIGLWFQGPMRQTRQPFPPRAKRERVRTRADWSSEGRGWSVTPGYGVVESQPQTPHVHHPVPGRQKTYYGSGYQTTKKTTTQGISTG